MKMTQAEADTLMRGLNEIVAQGLEDLRPEVADSRVTVLHGWPITVLAMDETAPVQAGARKGLDFQTFFIRGRDIVMRHAEDGDFGFVQAEVGNGFHHGQAVMRGARRAQGGVLVWERRCDAVVTGPSQMTVTWEPVVRLLSTATVPETRVPALAIQDYDQSQLEVRRSTGTLYQLAAHYTAQGVVTLYAPTPSVLDSAIYTFEA